MIWIQTTQNNKIECQKNDKKKDRKVIFGQWTNTKMAASAVIWQYIRGYHHLPENQTALECMIHRCSLTLLLPLTPSHLNFLSKIL